MAFQDLPLGTCSNIVYRNEAFVCTNCETLGFMVEGDHGKYFDHCVENQTDQSMRVLPKLHVVRIKTLKNDLSQENQMRLKVFTVASDKKFQDLKDICLVFCTLVKCCCLILKQDQKILGEIFSYFKKSPTNLQEIDLLCSS